MPGLFHGTPLQRPVTCSHCGRELADCRCPRSGAGEVVLPRDQAVRVRREKRRGKWNTVVAGLDAAASDLPGLLKRFRQECSAGGTLRDDGFELQGDHGDRVITALKALGYPAKAAGG